MWKQSVFEHKLYKMIFVQKWFENRKKQFSISHKISEVQRKINVIIYIYC